jgi:hypothetical protein
LNFLIFPLQEIVIAWIGMAHAVGKGNSGRMRALGCTDAPDPTRKSFLMNL